MKIRNCSSQYLRGFEFSTVCGLDFAIKMVLFNLKSISYDFKMIRSKLKIQTTPPATTSFKQSNVITFPKYKLNTSKHIAYWSERTFCHCCFDSCTRKSLNFDCQIIWCSCQALAWKSLAHDTKISPSLRNGYVQCVDFSWLSIHFSLACLIFSFHFLGGSVVFSKSLAQTLAKHVNFNN